MLAQPALCLCGLPVDDHGYEASDEVKSGEGEGEQAKKKARSGSRSARAVDRGKHDAMRARQPRWQQTEAATTQ